MMRSLKLTATAGMGIALASFTPGGDLSSGLVGRSSAAMAASESCEGSLDQGAIIQRLLISSAVAATVSTPQRVVRN